jgi:hypothetical protein
LKINFANKALLTVYWQNYKFYFWCLHTLVIYFWFESHDPFYRFLANQRNIQILDVEHEKIRDSCLAFFQPMPKLEEGLILRLLRIYWLEYLINGQAGQPAIKKHRRKCDDMETYEVQELDEFTINLRINFALYD